MQTGKLDKYIELFLGGETNVNGEVINGYTTAGFVWAEIISQRGAEAFEAARMNARETIRVRIRNRSDIGTLSKIEWDGVVYMVKYIDRTHERHGYTWFTAEAKDIP